MTSAFSAAEHSRWYTSRQLRRNHFSALAWSCNRVGLTEGANGAIVLFARVLPGLRGSDVWQVAQLTSSPSADFRRARKNAWPRSGEAEKLGAGTRAWLSNRSRSCHGLSA